MSVKNFSYYSAGTSTSFSEAVSTSRCGNARAMNCAKITAFNTVHAILAMIDALNPSRYRANPNPINTNATYPICHFTKYKKFPVSFFFEVISNFGLLPVNIDHNASR